MSTKTNSTSKAMHANARRRLIGRIRELALTPSQGLAFLDAVRATGADQRAAVVFLEATYGARRAVLARWPERAALTAG